MVGEFEGKGKAGLYVLICLVMLCVIILFCLMYSSLAALKLFGDDGASAPVAVPSRGGFLLMLTLLLILIFLRLRWMIN